MTPFLKICLAVVLVSGVRCPVSGQNPALRVAPPVPKTNWLTWNGGGAQEWKVSTGPVRGVWTNSVFVTTNRVRYVAGIAYQVETFDRSTSLLSLAVPYPSNRVARLVIEAQDMATGRTTETVWQTYTNAPDGGGKTLRLREELIRFE